ncbi:MAG: prepilin-type N-terminal cleavage/methylation domain-containing protein [Anaerovoracaceae bacterium]
MYSNRKYLEKGFTLVELIVVIVILAVLAAILIPSMIKYIDKAEEKTSVTECRSCVLAGQTLVSENYTKFKSEVVDPYEAVKLAEVPGIITYSKVESSKVTHLNYANPPFLVKYCSYGGSDNCGVKKTYTVSKETVTISETLGKDTFINFYKNLPSAFVGMQIDRFGLYSPNSFASQILKKLPPDQQYFLQTNSWSFYRPSKNATSDIVFYFTKDEVIHPKGENVSQLKVYKYDIKTDSFYSTENGIVKDGRINAQPNAVWTKVDK